MRNLLGIIALFIVMIYGGLAATSNVPSLHATSPSS